MRLYFGGNAGNNFRRHRSARDGAAGEISVRLPDNAVAPVLESDSEQVYLSEDYEIIVETVSGGDLSATIQRISGYTPDNLTVMETAQDGAAV